MKIIFLCGSLEPGRDGVGDYTRRLAVEMINQGHQATAIALKDWYITSDLVSTQHSENVDLEVFRIPFVWPSKKRFSLVKKYIDDFNPDWLSLQFVNFAFQQKGLHFGLSKNLAEISKGRRWHIMFHELWIGMTMEASIKHILWGKAQRSMIKSLILKLKPDIIHTQSRLYMAQLTRLGFHVEYLPLFSNIPLNKGYLKSIREKNAMVEIGFKAPISLVVFGSIHPLSPVEKFAKEAASYAKENDLRISIVFIGRNGSELEHWISVFKTEGVETELLGEQAPERISEVLGNATIGISTSTIEYIEKSGTVAAMREHGLPVICVSRSLRLFGIKDIAPLEGISEYKEGNFESCLKREINLPSMDIISEAAFKITEAFGKKAIVN